MFARSYQNRGAVLVALFLFVGTALAQDVDTVANRAIRKYGMDQSKVMETMAWLTDVHGPRLTGSPQLDRASQWAVEQLQTWGLQKAHLEPWGPFGRGWTLNSFSMNVTAPVAFPVIGYPQAWSPSTNGEVAGEVVLFDASVGADFSALKGKYRGKIVFVDDMAPIAASLEPPVRRRTAEDLLRLANAGSPQDGGRRYSEEALARMRLRQARLQFLFDEGVAMIVDRAYTKGGYGTMYVAGASVPMTGAFSLDNRPAPWRPGTRVIPQVTIAEEHYNRIVRLIQRGIPVKIETEIKATFNDDDPMEANVVAEIPGTDPAIGSEVVMLGAHLDSWHAGTGAQDNAAGVAVMMEAVRILKEVFRETGRQPRRTIRIALWTGEEQGLYGSRAYVRDHFADASAQPIAFHPEYDRFSAYYNLDNGSGKIRGIHLQGNEALRSIFRPWLEAFRDLDANTVSLANTGSTDHMAFDAVGLPGFQFIQDPVQYGRIYHSNMDVLDHVMPDDLKQAATVIASIVYHTAQRDEKLPRKPFDTNAVASY